MSDKRLTQLAKRQVELRAAEVELDEIEVKKIGDRHFVIRDKCGWVLGEARRSHRGFSSHNMAGTKLQSNQPLREAIDDVLSPEQFVWVGKNLKRVVIGD